MSNASKREILLPDEMKVTINELLMKQCEIIESLVQLNKTTLDLLSQYMNVEEYELAMARILDGDDVIIE